MEQTVREPENHFLRLFCFVVVIMVVLVHYWPHIDICGYDLVGAIQAIARFAMPVFFMVSGYYLYSTDGHSEGRLKQKAIRIFILILFIKFFYLALDIILAAFGFIPWDGILYDFLAFGDSTSHYWFVAALLTVYLVHMIFRHFKIDFKYIIPISVILLIIDLVFCEVLPLAGVNELMGTRIGDISAGTYVVICFFFFQAGYYIHKHKKRIDAYWTNGKLVIVMILAMALHIVELWLCTRNGIFQGTATDSPNVTIGTIIFSFAMFVASFRLGEDHFRFRPGEWMGKNCLSWMYAFATFGSYTLKTTVMYNYVDNFIIYDVVGPILAIVIDIVCALLMYFILKAIFGKKERKPAAAQT